MPRMDEATADFSYIRWLGDRRDFPFGTHAARERPRRRPQVVVGSRRSLSGAGQDGLRLRQQPLPEPLAIDTCEVPGTEGRLKVCCPSPHEEGPSYLGRLARRAASSVVPDRPLASSPSARRGQAGTAQADLLKC
jgi:hypothetical protein